MRTVNYYTSKRKNPSPGLSPRDYVAKEDLDFYQDTAKSENVFKSNLENTPITRIYDLIWSGDLGKFPKYYFDNITKDRKCEELLRYVYIDLYHFSKCEIMTMNHRRFLNDIKLSYICTSGLFPNYKSIISKILNIDERFLHGRKSIDITNKRNCQPSKCISKNLNSNNITNKIINKTVTRHNISSNKMPFGNNTKVFGQEKKDYLELKYILLSKGVDNKDSAIRFLILNKRDEDLSTLHSKYGRGIGLPQLLFSDLTIDEYNSYRDNIENKQ